MPSMVALAKPIADEQHRRCLVEELLGGFATLNALIKGEAYAVGEQLSFADCALARVLFAAKVTGDGWSLISLRARPAFVATLNGSEQDEHVSRVLAEMDAGLRQLVHGP